MSGLRRGVALLALAVVMIRAAPGLADEPAPFYGGSEEARRLYHAEQQYQREAKNPWAAFGWELLLPGLGNYYAGEDEEAALTWTGLMIGGVWLLKGSGTFCRWLSDDDTGCESNEVDLVMGWVFLVGSRLFGLTRAPMNVVRNNRALRAKLGLQVVVIPVVTRDRLALTLRLSF